MTTRKEVSELRWLTKLGLAAQGVIIFLFEEGWIIGMVALLRFWLAVLAVTALLTAFAILATYLCEASSIPPYLEWWLERQKKKALGRMKGVVEGLTLTTYLTTAVVVSPSASAVLMHLAGTRKRKAVGIDIGLSLVCSIAWCAIYGGGLTAVKSFIHHIQP